MRTLENKAIKKYEHTFVNSSKMAGDYVNIVKTTFYLSFDCMIVSKWSETREAYLNDSVSLFPGFCASMLVISLT